MLTLANTFETILFEKNWPIVVGLVVVWAGMRLVGVRLLGGERDAFGKRMRRASWGVLAVAALVFGLAWYVQTPCERLRSSMRQLLAAVEQEDFQAFDRLTADDATAQAFGQEFARAGMDTRLKKVKVQDITLLEEYILCDEEGDVWITTVRLRTELGGSLEGVEGVMGLYITVWNIQWRRLPGDAGWEAVRFEHEGSGIDAEIEPAP